MKITLTTIYQKNNKNIKGWDWWEDTLLSQVQSTEKGIPIWRPIYDVTALTVIPFLVLCFFVFPKNAGYM